jgi:hypothetical protein
MVQHLFENAQLIPFTVARRSKESCFVLMKGVGGRKALQGDFFQQDTQKRCMEKHGL